MTRAQISTLILSWLDDEQQGYFNATDVNQWINLAQRQVQMELILAGANWYMLPTQTTTVSGQSDYVLPSDFICEHRLEVVLSGTGTNENRQAITPITTNQQDLVSITLGPPTNYYIKKDRVTLLPTPDQAYTLRLYYSPKVADLNNDTDVPDVPEQFMEYLALMAAFDGYIKDDRAPENLLAKKAKYEDMVKRMKSERTQDQSRQVVQVREWDYASWW